MLPHGRFASLLLLFTAAATLASIGCGGEAGPDRAAISGSVSFDGKPVEEGTISFVPASGTEGPVAGATIQAGRYEMSADKGPVIGSHKVEIVANRDTGETKEAIPPATGTIPITEQYIPAKYNKQSTLTVEIKEGENSQDFDLQP